jgi:protein-ribulosamine 3-kinase
MLPNGLLLQLELALGNEIVSQVPVAGGDTSRCYCLCTRERDKYFVKFSNSAASGEQFKAEALGLAILGFSKVIRVPRVIWRSDAGANFACLVLEYIASGQPNARFWERLGQQLANLHGNTSSAFGFSHDNFIGAIRQDNSRHDSWSTFYANARLLPQMRAALDNGHLLPADSKLMDRLCLRLDMLCPREVPSLIHGDLWYGNILCTYESDPVLVDPSAYFGHREMDLAMAQLFGRFDKSFFHAYSNHWPLEPGFDARLPIYQLYYILIHVNMFGLAYVEQARTILKRYG